MADSQHIIFYLPGQAQGSPDLDFLTTLDLVGPFQNPHPVRGAYYYAQSYREGTVSAWADVLDRDYGQRYKDNIDQDIGHALQLVNYAGAHELHQLLQPYIARCGNRGYFRLLSCRQMGVDPATNKQP